MQNFYIDTELRMDFVIITAILLSEDMQQLIIITQDKSLCPDNVRKYVNRKLQKKHKSTIVFVEESSEDMIIKHIDGILKANNAKLLTIPNGSPLDVSLVSEKISKLCKSN